MPGRTHTVSAPFVGRDSELSALSELCARALDDSRPVAAAIIGEPEIGKSRLLAEARSRVDIPQVTAAGYELAHEVPFGAASGLLRDLASVPELGTPLDQLLLGQKGAIAGLDALRVLEATYRCLAEAGPRLLSLDDVQWADDQSLTLIEYLLRATAGSPQAFIFLCAGRLSAAVEDFGDRLRRLLGPDGFLEVRLGPLGHDESVELATGLAPSLTRADAEELWQKAQGSPFWLEALARGDGGATSSLQLLGARYRSLEPDEAALLALLVVAGRPLAHAGICELRSWDEARAGRAELVLVNRGLVLQEASTVRLAHDLIRESAARQLPQTERIRLHRRLAEWLEERRGDDLQALWEALEHRRASGLPVAGLALRLARSPQRRLLGAEGLALLAEIAQQSERASALQQEVTGLAAELGEWEVALESAVALSEQLPDRVDRASAALAAARAAYRLKRAPEAHGLLARYRALEVDDPLLEIEADAREAEVLRWLEDRTEDATEPSLRAVARARELVELAGGVDRLDEAERRAYVTALRAQLDAAIVAADAAAVGPLADEIVAVARDPAEALDAALDATFVLMFFEGMFSKAEPRARRVLEESRRLVLPVVEAEAAMLLAVVLFEAGKIDEAARLSWSAVELAERVGAPERFPLVQLRAVAHWISMSLVDWRRGAAGVEEQIRAAPEAHTRLGIRTTYFSSLARFAHDAAGEVRAQLAAAVVDADEAGCARCRWESILFGAEARARLGDLDEARSALEEWDSAHPDPRPGQAAWRAHAGALLTAQASPAESPPLFARAAKLAEQAGLRHTQLWIELDAAAALASVDRRRAVEELRRVADQAEQMGASSERQLAARALRRLGVRTWRRADVGAPLTDRELEIARLVADGASNPEIAGSLFLSRKTVERHVSNILRKLGARNRTELASLLARRDSSQEVEGAHR